MGNYSTEDEFTSSKRNGHLRNQHNASHFLYLRIVWRGDPIDVASHLSKKIGDGDELTENVLW